MSIVEKIETTESEIQEIRQKGQEEINKLQADLYDKEQQMRQMFHDEYIAKQQELEKNLAEKIAEYQQSKQENLAQYTSRIKTQFAKQKESIVQSICENFWKG